MRKDLGLSSDQLWHAIEALRRTACAPVWQDIAEIEGFLERFASAWLPIGQPEKSAAESSWLLDNGTWYLKYRGQPVVSRYGGSKVDEVRAVLEVLMGQAEARADELFYGLAARLREIQELRRLVRGAISGGVSHALLEYTGSTMIGVRLRLIQGALDEAAWWLRMRLAKVTETYEALPQPKLECRRSVYASLVNSGAPDEDFAQLLEEWSRELLGIVVENPQRPRRTTWCNLVGRLLSVIPNTAVV